MHIKLSFRQKSGIESTQVLNLLLRNCACLSTFALCCPDLPSEDARERRRRAFTVSHISAQLFRFFSGIARSNLLIQVPRNS